MSVSPAATDAGVRSDCDVLIAGAGLVGLALAPALAELGLTVALCDRAPVAMPADPEGDEDWDARVYAISPGSASFLRAVGAWQTLAPERITAVEQMRVAGDGGATLEFSAYDLGERALAWIVEERSLRAALVARAHAAGVAMCAPRTCTALTWSRDAATVRFDDGSTVTARLVVAADGRQSWVRDAAGIVATVRPYGQTAVVANFRCERAHHGRARQWFRERRWHPGVAAAAGTPDVDGLVRPRGACARIAGARYGGARGPRRGRGRACARDARMHHAGRRVPAGVDAGALAPLRIASRWPATRRTACIRWRARA